VRVRRFTLTNFIWARTTEYDVLNRVTETRNNAVFGFAPDSIRYAYDNLFPTTITSHVTGQPNQVYSLQHNALGARMVETDVGGKRKFAGAGNFLRLCHSIDVISSKLRSFALGFGFENTLDVCNHRLEFRISGA
jgi:hypothetical protein